MITSKDIIDFWFDEAHSKLWFNSTPEFDNKIRQRFESLTQAALNDRLTDWEETPEGCLALVIMLDQFPLNMYRGQLESFSGESKSRNVANKAIENGFDKSLSGQQKAFLYMPFMHSENLDDQDRSVELFEKADLQHNLRFAIHHREIIRQFGRFPHRNEILGRESSVAEIEYLNSEHAFHG